MASMIMKGVGAHMGAQASIAGAEQESNRLDMVGEQFRDAASSDRASSQRVAIEERKRAEFAESRARMLAAASGAAGFEDIFAGIDSKGEYNALTALYKGETSARTKDFQAEMANWQAKEVKRAGKLQATQTVMSMGSNMMGGMGKK